MITLDKLNDSEYEGDIDVPDLKSFFKKDDFDFSLPINCHYFTYIVNKICGFAKNGTSRKGNYDNYIDIRLANKKHKYFEIDEEFHGYAWEDEEHIRIRNLVNAYLRDILPDYTHVLIDVTW